MPRVLIARPPGRGAQLAQLLIEAGCAVEQHPLVDLDLEQGPELADALRALAAGDVDALVLTSRTAVEALVAMLPAGVENLTIAQAVQVVVVGDGTAAALRDAGREPDVIAAGSGAALVDAMPAPSQHRGGPPRVLFSASAAAAPTVPEGLAARGWEVRTVVAYRPRSLDLPEAAAARLRAGQYAALIATSPMIARRAAELGTPPTTPVVVIGAPTEAAATASGLRVAARAAAPTDAALATATRQVLAAGEGTNAPLDAPRPGPEG
ncbi:MAG: uroporphyrinogen-III synthase [Brachybacterium sp.]|nr:uroporphyrinogen-III synthase [Brachybacterium sp.]